MRPVPEPQLNHILYARFGGQYDASEPFVGGRFNIERAGKGRAAVFAGPMMTTW